MGLGFIFIYWGRVFDLGMVCIDFLVFFVKCGNEVCCLFFVKL